MICTRCASLMRFHTTTTPEHSADEEEWDAYRCAVEEHRRLNPEPPPPVKSKLELAVERARGGPPPPPDRRGYG
jgi:hypothetical protein